MFGKRDVRLPELVRREMARLRPLDGIQRQFGSDIAR